MKNSDKNFHKKIRRAALFDDQENRPALNGVASLHFDLLDLTGNGAANLVFHLHRFDNDQSLSLFDRIAFGYQHRDHLSRHRNGDLLPALELEPGLSAANTHPALIDQIDAIAPAIDQDPVLVLGMIDFDFEGAVVQDQGIVGASGLFTVNEELVAIDGNPVKSFADLFDFHRVCLLSECGDESHEDSRSGTPPAAPRKSLQGPKRAALALFAPFRRLSGAFCEQAEVQLLLAVDRGDRSRSQGDLFVRVELFFPERVIFFVDKGRAEVAGHEAGMSNNPLMKGDIGLYSAHLIFAERAAHPQDRFNAVFAPDDEFRDHRIIINR